MNNKDYCATLDQVEHIALEAGRRILDVYDQEFDVSDKEDGSPLTEADNAANKIIVKELNALTPDVPVLTEESEFVPYEKRKDWNEFWLVDPLDGTKEFIKRNGEFTVNIALIAGGKPVLGVVYVPVTGVCYKACAGKGACRLDGKSGKVELKVRTFGGERPIVVASRSHASEALQGYLSRLGEHDIVSMGSSLKFCLVAQGSADIYPRLGPTSEWDIAAAHCIVEAAGGKITDTKGQALQYNKPDLLNPKFLVSGAGDYDWLQYLDPSDSD
ncbi:MAG: 3'(2'),5'-bisphosphate nucleotidase CysQ [Gammaproteobacteria bacterium]|nr:MAG: 3'(2'),5'-bisphosphate nucleotidase CysQ [Gammaproteobacteria bacterium]